MSDITVIFKELCLKSNLSTKDICNLLNISYPTIMNLKNGTTRIAYDNHIVPLLKHCKLKMYIVKMPSVNKGDSKLPPEP